MPSELTGTVARTVSPSLKAAIPNGLPLYGARVKVRNVKVTGSLVRAVAVEDVRLTALTLNGSDGTRLRAPSLATRLYPDPRAVRKRTLNVARPGSANTARLPPRMAALGLLPRSMVTSDLSVVTTLPNLSSTRTMTAGVMSWPGTTVLGWVANTSCVATPGTAVAVKVAGLATPDTETVRVLVPAVGPRIQEV